MTIPTDEQLCEMSQEELKKLKKKAQYSRTESAVFNKWKQHQELGDLLCKLDQLIE